MCCCFEAPADFDAQNRDGILAGQHGCPDVQATGLGWMSRKTRQFKVRERFLPGVIVKKGTKDAF